MNKKIIWGIIIAVLIVAAVIVLLNKKSLTPREIIHPELVSKYPALKNGAYLQSNSRTTPLETEATVCDSQSVIEYMIKPNKDPRSVGGDWRSVMVFDCGSTYYVGDISDAGPKLFGPFDSVRIGTTTQPTSTSKIYTSTEGYSFVYPSKLTLTTADDIATLSHTIPFENTDGGCDMTGEGKVSKTLTDFNLSFDIKTGSVVPNYIDGTYAKGSLNGSWAYMGAEGCGETKYYFPISGNRTLIVTKKEIQILSDVVDPGVKANVLKVPGAISSEEAKIILDQVLSSFKFTNSIKESIAGWKIYKNEKFGYSFEYPDLWLIKNKTEDSSGVTSGVIFYSADGATLLTVNNPIREVGYETLTTIKNEKILIDGRSFTKTTLENEDKTIVVHLSWNEDNWNKSGEIWSQLKGNSANTVLNAILSTFKFTN